MISKCVMIIFSGICSFQDIRRQGIWIGMPLIFSAVGVICFFLAREVSALDLLGGVIVGIAISIASLSPKCGVSLGDGLFLVTSGLYLGLFGNLRMLFWSGVLVSCYVLVLKLLKRQVKKKVIPFIPFMTGGYLITLCM